MKILIIGGAGMIGRKLARAAGARWRAAAARRSASLDAATTSCRAAAPAGAKVPVEGADRRPARRLARHAKLLADKPDVIFHLAAIVSGEAEQEFDKGYRINMDGTRSLLEAVRAAGHKPRLVFASSIAVFGAPFPEAIGDEFFNTPLTSYGTQKTICELLDLRLQRARASSMASALRLPTICVRPGKPNKAASGFFSNIMREPLAGAEAVLPVSESVMHWHASPRAAVGFMQPCRERSTLAKVGPRRALTMPGLAVTVGEQIAALQKVAGDKVAARIRREPDPFHRGDRGRLAAQVRRPARARAGLQGRRQLRGDHPHPYRG